MKLTTIQEVLLEELEHQLKEVVYEKYRDGCSDSDYLREARLFVQRLVEQYTK